MTLDSRSVLAQLVAALPGGAVIVDPASMDAYRWDRALDPMPGLRWSWCVR